MSIHHCLSLASGSPVETTHGRLITETWHLGSFVEKLFTFNQAGLALAAHTLAGSECWHFLPPTTIFAARARYVVPQLPRHRVCVSLRAADFSSQANR